MKYDVIIAGGGTAGCAAAYTAGKLGLKTLLVEKKIYLGGAITSGLVIPAMKAGENQINTEFFEALTAELHSLGGQVTYQGNPGWFNPELAKAALDSLILKAGVEVLWGAKIANININNRLIESVKILSVYSDTISIMLSKPVATRYVIDATGNCDVGKLCQCEFLDKPDERQPVSLRFMMGGVDVETFGKWLLDFDPDRNVTTVEFPHLSTAYTWDVLARGAGEWALKPLFDDAVGKNILKDHDRNYFQVFTVAGMPGTIAFNCPRLLDCNIAEGRQSILRLTNFCKEYFPGFENAFISNIADELGVRVSKRIKGKYVYTIDDLKSGKKFENPVVIANYPVDVHSSERDKSTLQHVSDYQLPIESLMSADIDNLFVAGRCLSADFKAQGALRVQPSCFAMGEGVAKYIVTICK
ncbi:MAG: FAD-dependent oxidoreductase [Heliobacteriaceae bacterium]|jgi:hypothetical protein|nr:FAD-dependent oxidoreductase [Heliobacteriaceae bacterium]